MTYQAILTEQADDILTITLNRPDKLNAATDTMLAELNEVFKRADRDEATRAILLTGAGRGFCAGQDLAAAMERQQAAGKPMSYREHLTTTFNPLILAMRRHSRPIIGAINGVAAGAGMSIAMACDVRIAADSASFLQAFVKIGLIPDSGSTWLLPRLVGSTRALELMLTGRPVTAQEALSIGLINQMVPAAALMDAARQIATAFAAAPTKAIGYIKRAAEFSLTGSLEDALNNEADLQELAGRTADHHEGVAAFLEKRPARFTGV